MDEMTYELSTKASHIELLEWVMDCAYHVLVFYEELHPKDKRPRIAIESITKWINNEIEASEVRVFAFKAHKAAREATSEQAIFAARACGHAAATVYIKTHAIHSVNYALQVFNFSSTEKEKEQLWQYERLFNIKKRIIN